MKFSHLFVIGFNKTATTAIHCLFKDSGFRSVQWAQGQIVERMLRNLSDNRPIFRGYDKKYEVLSDLAARRSASFIEGNAYFPQMAADYPHAGFLYNFRNMDDWLLSRANHIGVPNGQPLMDFHLNNLGFRSTKEVIKHWKTSRTVFEHRLFSFFDNKSDRFVSLDVDSSEFVSDLAQFVGADLSPQAWRRVNVTARNASTTSHV